MADTAGMTPIVLRFTVGVELLHENQLLAIIPVDFADQSDEGNEIGSGAFAWRELGYASHPREVRPAS
jgi:hypothetical protein